MSTRSVDINKDLIRKFLKFGAVGFSGVFVDFGITWLVKEVWGCNQYLANSIGFISAVISNYILNRVWTFKSKDPRVAEQFVKFFGISLVGLAINNGIIYLLNEGLGLNFYLAKLIATGVVMVWNFGANILFTFKGN
jgi:putative flippase GtrA